MSSSKLTTDTENEAPFPVISGELCFSLYAATHSMTRAYRPLLEPLGLTYVQYLVLLVLWEADPRSVGELGNELYLDSGTLTPLLKRMERSELVKRVRDPDDERRVLIHLSAKGEALRSKGRGIASAVRCQIEMTPSQTDMLRQQLMQIVDDLA